MSENKYKSISNNSQNILLIEKSKFISLSFYVNSANQVKQILEQLRNQYYDATHICFAYDLLLLGQKCSDDGEPQGTAGKPILDCIQKQNLKNVLVVVVRYFGGIKLGAGGLVRAYSQSASLVLEKSNIKTITLCNQISLCLGYDEFNKIEPVLKSDSIKLMNKDFAENVEITLVIDTNYQSKVLSNLENILSRKIDYKVLDEIYY